MSVVITAPHAKCNENDIKLHMCDLISGEVAETLHKKLINSGIYSKLLIPDLRKIICNMNRLRCRKTKFRLRLTKYMRNNCKMLLDIHSFNKIDNCDLYIIEQYNTPQYVLDLINKFNDNNVSSKVFTSFKNDILNEARLMNIKSILLNFNESLDKNKIISIIDIIVEWVKSQL